MGTLMLIQNSTISQTGSASEKPCSKLQEVTDPGAMGSLWSRVASKYYSSGQEASAFSLKSMWALLENTGIRGTWRL